MIFLFAPIRSVKSSSLAGEFKGEVESTSVPEKITGGIYGNHT